ncbi:hypothetical protein KUTeg_019100 [Tegillarca granosa]|uniref:G-patch domain-containing protein n=1 Tax=Tegillarca granosa TaxID=220873 RepID=A0ABQ9EBJ3_TEGGR|nr:hypothetical protein KUTeg_019100 [Tegillarca granosa]
MDSDEDETFVSLGTPLELIDEVKDKKGRQRFHGAFTGGFSAGYFNSVGSKEGFTPSSFVSSRNKKPDNEFTEKQRPEYYMDDEDFEEHGIAPRKLTTSQTFASEERKRKRLNEAKSLTTDSAIGASTALLDLIIPERLTIGIKLLRKLGWKEGQGIGQRQQRKKKKKGKKGAVKTYGCALPPSSSEEEEIDSDSENFLKGLTFAPKDISPLTLEAKDNVHGIGYRGIDPRSALPSSHINLFETPSISKSGKKGIRGQAFGVGALEDDDDDIYAVDHMSNYDMTMEIDDGSEKLYGWTAPGRHSKGTQQTPVGYVGKILEGFTLSSKTLKPRKVFPPPQIPRSFKPFHHFERSTKQKKSRFDEENQDLNAVSRGLSLGEKPVFDSVFDLVPKKDRANIEAVKSLIRQSTTDGSKTSQNITASNVTTTATATTTTTITTEHPAVVTSPFLKGVGSLSLFKPFAKDPVKQSRYDKYLSLTKQGRKDAFLDVADPQMTEWDREKEKEEFIKASQLYKPLTGMMASRFTTAKHADDAENVDMKVEDNSKKDDKADAAKMKMFGRLTRETFDWHPDRLLCRRFNIPDPFPGSGLVGVPGSKRDKYSVFDFLSIPTQEQPQTDLQAITAEPTTDADNNKRVTENNKEFTSNRTSTDRFVAKNDDSNRQANSKSSSKQGNKSAKNKPEEEKEEEEDKPEPDLFRAIFRNTDSEDSSDEDMNEAESERNDDNHITEPPPSPSKTSEQLQSLEQRLAPPVDSGMVSPPVGPVPVQTSPQRLSPQTEDTAALDDDSYGPSLPPVYSGLEIDIDEICHALATCTCNPPGHQFVDLTTETHQKKKKHKQKDKHKHKQKHKKEKKTKHKSKHKKKEKKSKARKKDRNKDSSDSDWSSTDSDSDTDNVPSDRDLLQKLKSLDGGKRLKASDFM